MAVLRSGILGNLRGKVAGVVGSQWKDKNYLREYVKPANPQSAAQTAQREKMADCVAYCKQLVGQVFNPYTDRFQKSMSGFNRFIKTNIDVFDGSPSYSAIKITEGKLSPITTLAGTYNTADGETLLTWDENLGANGAAGDAVFWAIYDYATLLWHFADAETQRDAEADSQTLPTGLTASNLYVYAFAIKYVANIVNLISDSDVDNLSAP